jgi:hypothetical protein
MLHPGIKEDMERGHLTDPPSTRSCTTQMLATEHKRQCYHLNDKKSWQVYPCFTAKWLHVPQMGVKLFHIFTCYFHSGHRVL